jgi:hypothetical protein
VYLYLIGNHLFVSSLGRVSLGKDSLLDGLPLVLWGLLLEGLPGLPLGHVLNELELLLGLDNQLLHLSSVQLGLNVPRATGMGLDNLEAMLHEGGERLAIHGCGGQVGLAGQENAGVQVREGAHGLGMNRESIESCRRLDNPFLNIKSLSQSNDGGSEVKVQ